MNLLAIYVEDHLALSLGGVRLAKRALSENEGTPLGDFLARLLPELEEDRATLKEIARAIGGGRSALKEAAVVLGEYVGRMKLNGRLIRYSELSRLWELEGLVAGTESRRGLFRALGKAQKRDPRLRPFDLEGFEARASRHREELERWRLRAADMAFGTRPATKTGAPAPARG